MQCLAYELNSRGLNIEVEKELPVVYKGVKLNCGYRIDILVEKKIIIDLKFAEKLNDAHLAQISSYMKLTGVKLRLLVNFNISY